MPTFEVEKERIYIFELEEDYRFKHYFDREDIFSELQDHYNGEGYRFEVPKDEFPDVEDLLNENYFEPVIVDDPSEFGVVKEAYTEHADILRNSVMHWSRDDHNFFLMKDPKAVDQAVEQGASRISETEFVLGL